VSAGWQGSDDRLARAAARVHELARELVASAASAQRDAAALQGTLERGRDSTDLDAARLVAIELADAGGSREEVHRHLRASFGLRSLEGVLDDVFGPTQPAG
jgi:DNA invertase Pin-like site-specific DNA recombinase